MNAGTQARPMPGDSNRVDVFKKALDWNRADEARAKGLYPYFIPIEGSEGTEAPHIHINILAGTVSSYYCVLILRTPTDPRLQGSTMSLCQVYILIKKPQPHVPT